MGLQLLASRVLAPFFGNSIFVWASLITTFLAAFSAGSFIGAAVSSRPVAIQAKIMAVLMVTTSGWLLFDSLAGYAVTDSLDLQIDSLPSKLIIVCLLLYFVPVAALSALTPVCVGFYDRIQKSAGRSAGILNGVSTLGNIGGVLLTAFVLIPTFGVRNLLHCWWSASVLIQLLIMVRLALTLLGVTLVICHSAPAQIAPISVDTPYNHITIERFGSVVEMRSLWRTTIYRESAVDMSDPSHLIVPYTRFIAASAVFDSVPKNVLMIGLGGGGLNQFFERAFPGASFETVEIDQTVFRLAQEHMAFRISEKNKVTILDGRMFLRRSKTIYDWIILDAFRGGFVPPHFEDRGILQASSNPPCAARHLRCERAR